MKTVVGFLKELAILAMIAAIIVVFAVVPYYSNKHELRSHTSELEYDCKLNTLLKRFVNTATKTREDTAAYGGNAIGPRLKRINLQTAKIYKQIEKEIDALPPHDCSNIK